MGYAFEGVPWHEVPDAERLALWRMDAEIRDGMLNPAEFRERHTTLWTLGVRNFAPGAWREAAAATAAGDTAAGSSKRIP